LKDSIFNFMNQGIKTIIYPVRDIEKSGRMFAKLLGVKPYIAKKYYVGFKIGDQEIGLDPRGFDQGMTGPIGYYHVADIHKDLEALHRAGAVVIKDIYDVGGGKLIAWAKEPSGSIIGLLQM